MQKFNYPKSSFPEIDMNCFSLRIFFPTFYFQEFLHSGYFTFRNIYIRTLPILEIIWYYKTVKRIIYLWISYLNLVDIYKNKKLKNTNTTGSRLAVPCYHVLYQSNQNVTARPQNWFGGMALVFFQRQHW